jgi:hypothetical protein
MNAPLPLDIFCLQKYFQPFGLSMRTKQFVFCLSVGLMNDSPVSPAAKSPSGHSSQPPNLLRIALFRRRELLQELLPISNDHLLIHVREGSTAWLSSVLGSQGHHSTHLPLSKSGTTRAIVPRYRNNHVSIDKQLGQSLRD